MEAIFSGNFYNPTVGHIEHSQVIDEILNYMKEKPDKFYDIIVGCDSPSDKTPFFPVAIVVLRVGEGGRLFLKKVTYDNRKFYSFKERVLQEVVISCELALHFREELYKKLDMLEKGGNWQFRYIHADLGENGATKDMIKEAVGLIKGNGFEPKIKPESCVASVVADRYT